MSDKYEIQELTIRIIVLSTSGYACAISAEVNNSSFSSSLACECGISGIPRGVLFLRCGTNVSLDPFEQKGQVKRPNAAFVANWLYGSFSTRINAMLGSFLSSLTGFGDLSEPATGSGTC